MTSLEEQNFLILAWFNFLSVFPFMINTAFYTSYTGSLLILRHARYLPTSSLTICMHIFTWLTLFSSLCSNVPLLKHRAQPGLPWSICTNKNTNLSSPSPVLLIPCAQFYFLLTIHNYLMNYLFIFSLPYLYTAI